MLLSGEGAPGTVKVEVDHCVISTKKRDMGIEPLVDFEDAN